jgi:hypothetical protein
MDPSFVLQFKDASDTAYFAQRYEFRAHEDASIIDGIASEMLINDDDLAIFFAVNFDSPSVEENKIVQRAMLISGGSRNRLGFILRMEHTVISTFFCGTENSADCLRPGTSHPINCRRTSKAACYSEKISKLSDHRAGTLNAPFTSWLEPSPSWPLLLWPSKMNLACAHLFDQEMPPSLSNIHNFMKKQSLKCRLRSPTTNTPR